MLVSAFAAGSAVAANWVDAAPSSGAALLQLDSDSVTPAGANRFKATWRTGTGPGRPYFVKQGEVDCAGESLQIATATYVETEPSRSNYGDAVTDFAAGTRTWRGRTTRLTGAERAEGNEFPAANDPGGRLVRLVCGDRSDAQTAATAATALQQDLGCSNSSMSAAPLCAGDAATLATLRSLVLRLDQVQQACMLSAAQTARLRVGSLASAHDCARSATVCSVPPLQAALAGLGSDLARAAAGQACAYVPEALDRVADDAAERAAIDRFQACVTRSIPLLDDKVSQADVVARGVFGTCRGEFPAEVAQGPAFANGLLPGLTAAVLKYRSGGRATIPTKPKRAQAD